MSTETGGGGCGVREQQHAAETVETIRVMLLNRISMNIPNNMEMARDLLVHLGTLRSLLNADGPGLGIAMVLCRTGLLEMLMSNVTTLLRYENVTDECLRVVAPLTRVASPSVGLGDGSGGGSGKDCLASPEALALQRTLMTQLFSSGGVVFVLLALRGYMNSSLGVRLQGLEVLSTLLEFVALTEENANMAAAATGGTAAAMASGEQPVTPKASGLTRTDYQGVDTLRYTDPHTQSVYAAPEHRARLRELTRLPTNCATQDCVHQLLLHGAGVVLVRMLQYSVASQSEVAARRATWCLRFLLLDTPPSFAVKVAKYDQFCCVKALASQFAVGSKAARLEAAILLTGLLSADVEVCGALTSLGSWDELSSILAQNAELVCVPPHWLQGSLDNIKRLDQNTLAAAAVAVNKRRPPGGKGLRNNGADEVSAVETALLASSSGSVLLGDGGGSFEEVLSTLLENTTMSARERAGRWSRPGSRTGGSRPGSRAGGGDYRPGSRANAGSRPTSRGRSDLAQSTSSPGPMQMMSVGASGATSMPDLISPGKPGSPSCPGQRPNTCNDSPIGRTSPWDIKTSNFAIRLMENPLGEPVDPVQRKKMLRKHGGKLPRHVPHALGGPKLGTRPGPDYGSKTKKKEVTGSGLGQRPKSSGRSRPSSATQFAPLADHDMLHPTPGNHTHDKVLEQQKRAAVKVAKQAKFIATKLFHDGGSDHQQQEQQQVNDNGSEASLEKLNFAERLQCMIMQVQDLG